MDVAESVSRYWGLAVERVEPLDGGMNSHVWRIDGPGGRWVLKVVGADDTGFAPGLELASELAAGGLLTGDPIPSLAGRSVEPIEDRQTALLRYVDGFELGTSEADQRAIGRTLAQVHQLSPRDPGDLDEWLKIATWFDPYLDYEPWIRPAVDSAVTRTRELADHHALTWSGLHGDPAPAAFLRTPDDRVALIDWGAALTGPTLYDLASAVMYLGTPHHLIPAYGNSPEIEAGLNTFLTLRQAVQAGYFAWRCSTEITTGIPDQSHNRTGLANAHAHFLGGRR